MKKLVTTMMGAMLVTITAIAQVTPMVLGDKHAMLRMNEKSKYILLPVQETEEIAAIAVLDGSNNMVQRMNVKLAVDRVDYFVPYELKGAKLFDIEFHGDRRQKGAVSEFTCWKEIKFSDDFDTANREHFRPAYHHTPQYGWMNDPNGMFYKDGVWHLYYQYNPYGSQWENMHWGEGSGALGGTAPDFRARLAGKYLQRIMYYNRQRCGGILHLSRSSSDTVDGCLKRQWSHICEI